MSERKTQRLATELSVPLLTSLNLDGGHVLIEQGRTTCKKTKTGTVQAFGGEMVSSSNELKWHFTYTFFRSCVHADYRYKLQSLGGSRPFHTDSLFLTLLLCVKGMGVEVKVVSAVWKGMAVSLLPPPLCWKQLCSTSHQTPARTLSCMKLCFRLDASAAWENRQRQQCRAWVSSIWKAQRKNTHKCG